MRLASCARSDRGRLRSTNEDSLHNDPGTGLFIVADGLGGHAAGEIASRLAVEHALDDLGARSERPPALADLVDTVAGANRRVREAAAANPAWHGMGTTLTILACHSGQARLAHVGDSRLYRFRHAQLEQLSHDQTLLGEQLRSGLMPPEAARGSNLGHILLQAVGLEEELDIQSAAWPLQPGDIFLLCSDGLSDMLSDARIATILGASGSLAERARQLEEQALEAGGRDNVSLVLVEVVS